MEIRRKNVLSRLSLLPFVAIMMSASCGQNSNGSVMSEASTKKAEPFTLMFYNVENLFDIADDPKTLDDDFTPSGKYNWTTERYNTKLSRIAEVIDELPGKLPAFVGLAEIENRTVLNDLIKQDKLLAGRYAIIHKDSPDERGIDVAALVDTTLMQVEYYNYTTINLPNDADPYTRDMLYIKAKANGEAIHFFVNHWPSRGGGQKESEKNRIAVANVLDSQVKKIIQSDKDAKIIIMGDFNDHPNDKSVVEVLEAGNDNKKQLYNYMYDYHAAGKGSYWYKGEWGALDQFITTKNVRYGKNGWTSSSAFFFDDASVMFTDREGNKRPNRTYAGDKYTGGYSDHLAIYMLMTYR